MKSELKEAKLSDIASIVKIYNDSIKSRISTADTKPVSEEEKRLEFKNTDTKRYPIWVVEYHEKVIAFIAFKPFYGRDGYQKTCEISIYIDRNFQGQKLGQKFLASAIERLPKYGFVNALAFIFKDNLASVKLFKKLGFKEWGNLPQVASIDDIQKDLLILGYRVE